MESNCLEDPFESINQVPRRANVNGAGPHYRLQWQIFLHNRFLCDFKNCQDTAGDLTTWAGYFVADWGSPAGVCEDGDTRAGAIVWDASTVRVQLVGEVETWKGTLDKKGICSPENSMSWEISRR
jgi:hypothetical protein